MKSVNYQTYLPLEVIVVISGCNRSCIRDYESDWRSILNSTIDLQVIVNVSDLPAGTNRQLGAMKASGDLISWFDADDLQLPDRLNQIELTFQNEVILVVYHRFLLIEGKPNVSPDRNKFLYEDAIRMYHRGWVSVRKNVITMLSWSDRKRAQDFIYQRMVLSEFGSDAIALIPEFLGMYFQFPHTNVSMAVRKLEDIKNYYEKVVTENNIQVNVQQ